MVPYGIQLLNNLKNDDEHKYVKRFFYSIIITIGIILFCNSIYEIVLYNRLNPIRRAPRFPDILSFSSSSSPSSGINNNSANI